MTDQSRYDRQQLLWQIGPAGQDRLAGSCALLVGCGALGSVIADLLVRAGLGELRIVDRDTVEASNLQRQTLFDEADAAAGTPKAIAAAARLGRINASVSVAATVADFSPANAPALADGADVLLDGTDNFETRYLLNDLAVRDGLPYVYGGAVGTTGTLMTVLPTQATGGPTPCLRCLFPQPPAGGGTTCDTVGVLGPLIAIVAGAQATEAIKLLVGDHESVDRRLRSIDAWSNQWRAIDLSDSRQADCPCCGERRFEYLDGKGFSQALTLCGRNAIQISPSGADRPIDLPAIASQLRSLGPVDVGPYTLKAAIRQGDADLAITLFGDGRAIIAGTDDPATARSVYSRLVGL